MPRFIEDSPPELVIEKMDFLGDTHADTHARFRNRKSASRQIRRITNLLGDLQNSLARSFLDAAAPMQSAIHRADGHICHFGDAVDSVFTFAHLTHSATRHSRFCASLATRTSAVAPRRHARSDFGHVSKWPNSFSCSGHPS